MKKTLFYLLLFIFAAYGQQPPPPAPVAVPPPPAPVVAPPPAPVAAPPPAPVVAPPPAPVAVPPPAPVAAPQPAPVAVPPPAPLRVPQPQQTQSKLTQGPQKKRIAIINTVDDGKPSLSRMELDYLTDRLREIAMEVLSQKHYTVMTQGNITDFLGDSVEKVAKECNVTTCLADIGDKISADYAGQARIARFGKDFTIKTELYESKTGTLIGFFTGNSKEMHDLLSIINEKAPILFKKLPQEPIVATPVSAVVPRSFATYAPAPTATQSSVELSASQAEEWLKNNTTSATSSTTSAASATSPTARAYTGSNTCYKEIFNLPKNDMQSFVKNLGISVAKVHASCKTKFTCPADDKITDVGLTAGCIKQLPTSVGELQNVLKEIGLDLGISAATQAVSGYAGTSDDSEDTDEEENYFEIGYQRIWDMNHIRWSYGYFYNTLGYSTSGISGSQSGYYYEEKYTAFEFIIGGIFRWVDADDLKRGIGLFGGLGGRFSSVDYQSSRYGNNSDSRFDVRHELGAEFILGHFSFYVSERNFHKFGIGAGLIF